jgi:hypothetical protein
MKLTFTRTILIASFFIYATKPSTAQVSYLYESFDAVTAGTVTGWTASNQSSPLGTIGWFQGNTTVSFFSPQQGTGYMGGNYQNTDEAGVGTISNWIITPTLALQNGYIIKFWTRTLSTIPATYPDRLQVRLSTAGASNNVGSSATSVGDFTTLLTDINPTYTGAGYPGTWTEYSLTLSGLPGGVTSGKVAIRYFVENGGGTGANSNYIGIDNFLYSSNGVLPVTLTNFTSAVDNNNKVTLQWQTATEQNNAHFAIERSLDGVNFSDIAKVNGKGNSTNTQYYNFDDITANSIKGANLFFYRLRQTDFDGQFKYSSVVQAKLKKNGKLAVLNTTTLGNLHTIRFNAAKNSNVTITLLNSFGQQLSSAKQIATEGVNTVTLNAGSLAKGIYFIKITDGNEVITERFLR